ncbi:RES family NAD+ phosphorylase [Pelagicoccus mobilis]|uniref:RES family NAD+ phosphorylase n=1 Tax=Pelagicoccus mobilis TaxID=415221 RepID=A0A934S3L2_9BACT|nr:RES family NAD+ phosphorylase [Pelagicoccus mobilis]MBK1878784.1 RES family NAD+ phosphorylase [Pelagicoccus mobilis]
MPLKPHPDFDAFCRRIQNLPKHSSSQFNGSLFRFVSPNHSTVTGIRNGRGGLKASGRWHLKGSFPCLYTATTPETALQEALAQKRYHSLPDYESLPRVLIGLKAKLLHLLDLTDGRIRQRLRISESKITECDWRDENRFENQESITQSLGRAIYNQGYEGIIAPSSADQPDGVCLVLFPSKFLRDNCVQVQTPVDWN